MVLEWVWYLSRSSVWVGVVLEWVWCLGGQWTWSACLCSPPLPQGPWDVTAQSESALDGSVSTMIRTIVVVQHTVQITSLQHE